MDKNDIVEETTQTPEELVVEENTTDESLNAEELAAELGRIKREKTRLEKKLSKKEETPEIINNNQVHDNDRLERLELKLDGYADAEIDQIMQHGGKAFLETDLGKKAAEIIREQRLAEEATRIKTSSKSDFEEKYSKQELEDMSTEELAKILPKQDN